MVIDIYEHRKTELKRQERVKELRCLYGISEFLAKSEMPSDELIQNIVSLILPAMTFPPICAANIIIEGKVYGTENFREATPVLSQVILMDGYQVGLIQVRYLEAREDQDEGPFLEEEHCLLVTIANQSSSLLAKTRVQNYENFRTHVLEHLVRDETLPVMLDAIVRELERMNPAMWCSILLLDVEGKCLKLGAAPSLPGFYNEAIDGLEIGNGVGSCGTAAFTGVRVVVEGIVSHTFWVPDKEFAERAQLGACWSQPILASSGKVLGTFAIYHHPPQKPTESEFALIEQYAYFTGLAIEKCLDTQRLRILSAAIEQSPVTTVITDEEGTMEYVNPKFTATTGYTALEAIGQNPRILSSGDRTESESRELRETMLSGMDWHGVFHNSKKIGELYWESAVLSPVKDKYGNSIHFLAIKEDITERKKMEAELILSREEALDAKRSKSEFLSSMSNEGNDGK